MERETKNETTPGDNAMTTLSPWLNNKNFYASKPETGDDYWVDGRWIIERTTDAMGDQFRLSDAHTTVIRVFESLGAAKNFAEAQEA
jgi:hypothetical protein